MKKIFVPAIFRQIRNCHTGNSTPLGQRLTYLPPRAKPKEKSKDVAAILFGCGIEKQDDLRSEMYR